MRKKASSHDLENRLAELEEKAAQMGICIHYDLLEAAGLKLKGGLCRIKGEYHLFLDRRTSLADKINTLKDHLNRPVSDEKTPILNEIQEIQKGTG
jgi:hypothetical protein